MLVCIYNFVSSKMSSESGRGVLNNAHYRVHTSPEHVMVSTTCNLIKSLFQEGDNLTITLRPSPEPSPAPFYRSGPSPGPPWSDDWGPLPTYQDVMDGRVESHVVDLTMPPLEDGAVAVTPTERTSPRPSHNMWEERWRQRTNRDRYRSPPNIFNSNRIPREVNNGQRGRGLLGLNNAPRGRGLLGLNNALRGKDS